jgi:AcrR family transcriptional regulator
VTELARGDPRGTDATGRDGTGRSDGNATGPDNGDATARATGPDHGDASGPDHGDATARAANASTRTRGRQAEARRNDQRVLDAARAVVARYGADAPVSAIAEQAGVGMGSLYRRYGSKTDLLQHLCRMAMNATIEAAEEALAEPEPWRGLAGYIRACIGQRTGTLGALAGSIETTPDMWATSKRSRALLDQILTRVRATGQLRPDVTVLDIAWLIETLSRSGPAEPSDEDAVIRQRLATIATDGLRASAAAGPLPGEPPTARHYEARWQVGH